MYAEDLLTFDDWTIFGAAVYKLVVRGDNYTGDTQLMTSEPDDVINIWLFTLKGNMKDIHLWKWLQTLLI